jgi:hypothetical protein
MLSLKTHAVITGSLFAAIIIFAMVGNVLHDAGYLPDSSFAQIVARGLFFGLFIAFGFSCIPLMVKLVLAGQTAIGNADVAVVRKAAANERRIVFTLWLLIALGFAVALPAAIHDGFFDTAPPEQARPPNPR